MQNHPPRNILGVIPARLNSKRLPGKVLRRIGGKPMLAHVYAGASRSPLLNNLIVATDSIEVLRYCEQNRMAVLMTSDAHRSGTDRIHEVLTKLPADIYVNIQGDEPLIRAEHIESLLQPFFDDASLHVTTLKIAMTREEAANPNQVKVVTDRNGKALYFSRSMIPYSKSELSEIDYFRHIGVYAYTRWALEQFHRWPSSILERSENLEQLRFLENGIAIHVSKAAYNTIGVDTEDDLRRVELYLRVKGQGTGIHL